MNAAHLDQARRRFARYAVCWRELAHRMMRCVYELAAGELRPRHSLVGALACLLVACSPSSDNAVEQPATAADRGAARGELLFLQCIACHTLRPGDGHRVGPNLAGFFGQPAAAKAGFRYSKALKESGLVWTAEALDEWLARPNAFLPGSTMAFAGIPSERDRADLIAYLRVATED